MYKGNRGAWKQQNLGEGSVYRKNEGSLETAESRETELPCERTRGFWKLPNPGRPICVPQKHRGTWKQQELGRQFVYRGAERARSLKTVEAGEVDSCAGGARGDWKPHNLGRCGSVQQKLGQPENRGSQGMALCGIAVGARGSLGNPMRQVG